jgi:hypothetical protein
VPVRPPPPTEGPPISAPFSQLELSFDREPEAELPARLRRLGLSRDTSVTLTRNRTVLVSWDARGGLRLHAGYAWAPDEVLEAIVRFISRKVPRRERLAARRRFLGFPVDRHVPSRRSRRERPPPPEHAPIVERLTRLHEILNQRHFDGSLASVPIRVSERMESRLGDFAAGDDRRSLGIGISLRHLNRDGWPAVTETLLHEMIHQWQCETGREVDHGAAFRHKARELGITARARVRL